MSKMSDMAMTIEELRSVAAAINEAANWLATQFGGLLMNHLPRSLLPKKKRNRS